MGRFLKSVVAASLVGSAGAASAGEKDRYTLFAPTPRADMRELSTDRPDLTESPFTVDAGHFQAELSLVEWSHDDDGGVESDTVAVLPTNLKVGLLNNADLQFIVNPYVNVRTRGGGGASDRLDGGGDTQLRLKVNVWGNDGGPTALAVMPYVSFPTGGQGLSSERVEGGVIVPLWIELPAEFSLTVMAEIDVLRDAAGDGWGVGFLHTASIARPIAGELSGFVEYVGFTGVDLGTGYQAAVGCGVTYLLTPDIQLDAAASFGISDAAEDFNLRFGVSVRI